MWEWTPFTEPPTINAVAMVDGEPALLALPASTDGEWYLWQNPNYFQFGGC